MLVDDNAVNLIIVYIFVVIIQQNVADIKKLKQAGICTIKVSPLCLIVQTETVFSKIFW